MPQTSRAAPAASFLATLALELQPARPPFYVSASADGRPDGWYWTPQGEDRLAYLGRNVLFAERRLLELLRNGHA